MQVATSDLEFALAAQTDETELRRLMRACPQGGALALAMEREPDFFLGATIEGDVHQTLVAREPGGKVVGMGSRSVRTAWLDGKPRRLGYLGQLRIDPAYRGMVRVLRRGYEMLHELHQDAQTPFYLSAIAERNLAARRILEAGLPGFPTYRPAGELATLVLATGPRRPVPVETHAPPDLAAVADLLARQGANCQFAPVWTAADLGDAGRVRGLSAADFVVVERAGRLAGCAAVWDQRAYKQVRVHAYGGRLARWRPALNLVARLRGLPFLPPPGELVDLAYLSHLAIDSDQVATFAALLDAARERAARRDIRYLALGLAARSPLRALLVTRFRAVEYRTLLYLVHWDDGARDVDALGPRLAQPEIAVM